MSYLSSRTVIFLALIVFTALNVHLLSPAARSYFSEDLSDASAQHAQPSGSFEIGITNTTSDNVTNNGSPASDNKHNTIAFAFVMFGPHSAREGLLALKTALMHVSRPTVFHIICSQDAIPTIEEKLALFSRPAYPVRATFYPLTQDDISRRAARAGVGTSHEAGMGGLVKTFIHEVLHDVERIIFVDTDMLFLVDPALLWREFDAMDENQMVAFPTLGPKSHSGWICTCVMILNLKAMRERMFMPSNLLPTTPSLGSPDVWKDTGTDPYNPDYGDQGLYWAIWQGYPQHFKHLSISWDTTHCRYSYGMSLADGDENMSEEEQVARQWDTQQAPERFKQLFPAILHFNCQNMDVVWDDDINQRRTRWGPFVTIAIQYKWIWLNRGDGSATVQVNTVEHPVFWDELVASASTGDVDESTKQPVHGHGHGWGGHRS